MTDITTEPLTAPSPATTHWVPVGPGITPPPDEYLGDWQSSVTYDNGDVVVYNGVVYMAMRSTTQTPGGWPVPAGGVPQPVVNGQWIKGVNGAAVWQPIAQTDLPVNLQPSTSTPPNNDLNQITQSGWYASGGSTANNPTGSCTVFALVSDAAATNIMQIAYPVTSGQPVYMRQKAAGTWSSWALTDFITSNLPRRTTGTFAAGPPASPAVGDIWTATACLGSSAVWTFSWQGSYWMFTGGYPATFIFGNQSTPLVTGWNQLPGSPTPTVPRTGVYSIRGSYQWYQSDNTTGWTQIVLSASTTTASANWGYCVSTHIYLGGTNYWNSNSGLVTPTINAGQIVYFNYYVGVGYYPYQTEFEFTPIYVS